VERLHGCGLGIHARGGRARAGHLPARQTAGVLDLFESPLFPLFIVFLIFIIFTSRSRRKEEQKKKDLLGSIKRGDRVQTIGGILGTVVEVEEARVRLKVDESSNTKIWFSRNALFRVLGEEKAVDVAAK
jgi:preprotein translocase subunit YajC